MKIILTIPMLVCCFILARAQENSIITDRPDMTESAVTVPRKALQLETGFVFEKGVSGVKNYSYNTSLFRYGILERLELRLGLDFIGVKESFEGSSKTVNGLAPIVLGFKTSISEENGIVPQMAFLGSFIIPNTGKSDFENDNLGGDFRFLMQYTINESMSFGVNCGAFWSGQKGEDFATGVYTATIASNLYKKLGGFIEFYGDIPEQGKSDHRWDMGLTYLINDDFQLDISGGSGLGNSDMDYFISMGFSVRFP